MKIRRSTVVLLIVLPAALAGFCAAQNPLAALEDAAKEKAAETAIETLLNNQLPLTLNANDVYPTVANLPGGPFNPQPLKLTADELNQPLAPGDYTINTLDFCSEYSVHAPGAGVAYVLGPYEGKAAGAIGALIWRGTVQYHINPNSLQAVSWAIQSGLTYSQMPKTYQGIIDQVIADYKSEINGDFVSNLETTYNNAAKTAKLPPLDTILAKLGKPGELALSAERQRAILTAQGTNDQLREQTLFQGQQSGLYTPVKAENGPWTERVKGQVYMKPLIAGGNMASNNVMQIRVMPPPTANASNTRGGARLIRASYGEPQVTPALANEEITMAAIMQGTLGYSQGQGAQALGQVPVVSQSAPQPTAPPTIAQGPAAPAGPVQGPPPPPGPVQGPPAPPVYCPKVANASGTQLNIVFTSYTTEILDQNLYYEYLGLYQAGTQSSAAGEKDTFSDRMNLIAAKGQQVCVFVVNGDNAELLALQQRSRQAYLNAENAVNAQHPDNPILVPKADEIIVTFKIPDNLGGGYEVVMSVQALMNGYYDSDSPTDNSNSSLGKPGNSRKPDYLPLVEPIQIPLAYELGTNVYNLVNSPGAPEQMKQQDSNRFIRAEFPYFAMNNNDDSGSEFYGDIPCQPQHPTHGVFDLQQPKLGPAVQGDDTPTTSYYSITKSEGNLAQLYVPQPDPSIDLTDPDPANCPTTK